MTTALSCRSPVADTVSPVDLTAAFPASLAPDVTRALSVMGPHWLPAAGSRSVIVAGERLTIPYRLYVDPPETAGLSPAQRLVLNCLYSRHHDGYVRKRHLEALMASRLPWVVPYVFLPIGEYVIEIVHAVLPYLSEVDEVRAFAGENPDLLGVTRQRAASYWDEYNRRRYPNLRDYPAFAMVESLRRAARP